MFWILLLSFTVLPAVELYLLVQIGQVLGAIPTVCLTLLIGAAGAALARREGLSVLRQLQQDLTHGLPPSDRVVEGLLVLFGAILLITPGVISDAVGLACLFPPMRRRLAPLVKRAASRRFRFQLFTGGMQRGVAPSPPPSRPDRVPFDHPVA